MLGKSSPKWLHFQLNRIQQWRKQMMVTFSFLCTQNVDRYGLGGRGSAQRWVNMMIVRRLRGWASNSSGRNWVRNERVIVCDARSSRPAWGIQMILWMYFYTRARDRKNSAESQTQAKETPNCEEKDCKDYTLCYPQITLEKMTIFLVA